MRLLIMTLFVLILSGCATTQQTEKVLIPVSTKCYDKPIPKKPELNVDKFKGDEKIDIILNGALQDINNLEVYSDTLLTYICK